MGRVKGGAPMTLRACEEQVLLGHVESAAAGKTILTTDQMVDLLCSVFPESYCRRNRKLLTQRVAKFIPQQCRISQAKKRRKIDEPRIVNSQNEHKNPLVFVDTIVLEEDESSDSDSSSDRAVSGDSGGSDELGDGSREMNKNGDNVNGINHPISGDFGGSDKLGDGRREMNDNGDAVSGNNRPMFRDLGGMSSVINELTWEVIVPLHQLELLHHLGVEPTARILLHGPPGCGKTTLARALANEAGLPLYEISAADFVSGVSGASEENIRQLFSKAYMRAPSIVFIDEIDAMASKTESLQKEIEQHIVNQLMACMDEPNMLIKPVNRDAGSESSNSRPGYVLVIGATDRPDAVDPALRRRFDREIVIDVPGEYGRDHILSLLTRNLKVEDGFDLLKIARCTLGFVGGDLVALVKKAGTIAVKRIMVMRKYNKQRDRVQFDDYYRQPFSNEEMKNVSITMADFVEAGKMVRPSSKVEDFSISPNAKWDDVGGLGILKLEFERHIVKRIKFPEVYKDLGVNFTTTFFLYGPSGCGKALIVEALANEAGAKFIHIKGPELMKEYGSQSELVVRIIFSYARTCSPCIVFFDEVEADFSDALPTPDFRQLLTEWNGAEERSGFYVIAATNRPEVVSFGRGTFEKLLYVPLPNPEERGAILKTLARNKPIDANVELMALGKDVACQNFNGADLSALMKEAAMAAIDRPSSFGGGCRLPWTIKDEDFKCALKKISPSVPRTLVKRFERFSPPC